MADRPSNGGINTLLEVDVIDIPSEELRRGAENVKSWALMQKIDLFWRFRSYLNKTYGKIPKAIANLSEGSDFIWEITGDRYLCEDLGLPYNNWGSDEIYTLRAAVANWFVDKLFAVKTE